MTVSYTVAWSDVAEAKGRASEIESMKSASSCRFAGGRAASGMIGWVGSLKWSAIYQTVPTYLGFV